MKVWEDNASRVVSRPAVLFDTALLAHVNIVCCSLEIDSPASAPNAVASVGLAVLVGLCDGTSRGICYFQSFNRLEF